MKQMSQADRLLAAKPEKLQGIPSGHTPSAGAPSREQGQEVGDADFAIGVNQDPGVAAVARRSRNLDTHFVRNLDAEP